ncbi:MAG: alpha-2-macroglobulin family protein [Myxococcota bacterium]
MSFLLFLAACAPAKPPAPPPIALPPSDAEPLAELPPSPEPAPEIAERLPLRAAFADVQSVVHATLAGEHPTLAAITVDKPLYEPGEDLWLTVRDLRPKDLRGADGHVEVRLVDPRGAIAATRIVALNDGVAGADFALADSLAGGRYVVRALRDGRVLAERPVILNRYEPPRVKKTLDFVRKAYGAGDTVLATVEVKRPTGEPLADVVLDASIDLDGRALDPVKATTDATGTAMVRFRLPATIERGDGLLTVKVEDGGVTESISRAIPIVVEKVDVALFPEGGDLVAGLPSRVYVEARSPLGKPADVAGRVVDDRGEEVARFRSLRDGRARFAFTPAPGRRYEVRITEPKGVAARFPLPEAKAEGCVLHGLDDFAGELDALRVGVRCSEARVVDVQAVIRGEVLDAASLRVPKGEEAVLSLASADEALNRAQGAARVTVFDGKEPLAERLVWRNLDERLRVEISADRARYRPRDRVSLAVRTTDARGVPVPARLSLAVVDDTVLSYADDEEARLAAQLLLLPELSGTVEEPEWYFDPTHAEAGAALDLVMGTRGWRTFDWAPVFDPPVVAVEQGEGAGFFGEVVELARMEEPAMAPAPRVMKPVAVATPVAAPLRAAEPPPKDEIAGRRGRLAGGKRLAALGYLDDAVTPVRVFPAPVYAEGYDGPRVDWRQTVHWVPDLATDERGEATVSFHTSDAVTSFRARAEGVGGGAAGAGEAVIASSLPFSMDVKLPVAVSEGDRLDLPITLTNETDDTLAVDLAASLGELFAVERADTGVVEVPARSRVTRSVVARVTGKKGVAKVVVKAESAGLADEVARELTITPLGFPQTWSASGQASGEHRFVVDLGEAVAGTVDARVQLYPSPVATLTAGLEGMLREPSGCFEQTSSSNYPNVMVLRYLEEHGGGDAATLAKAHGLVERGYQRLVGFETPKKGYEWFGSAPAHEALTAYGLVEFLDMRDVHPDVSDAMIARTRDWLLSRRDGRGGFKRDPKALDSFGRASPEVTDAYVTWALARAKVDGIDRELDALEKVAATTDDAYRLALATGALLHAGRPGGKAAADRLAALQDADGGFTKAAQSITASTGPNLHVETTSLATLALLQDGEHAGDVREAVAWLDGKRNGSGAFGATQATVLGLAAMTEYARTTRQTRGPGTVEVRVNGELVERLSYEAGHPGALVVDGFGPALRAGENEIVLTHDGEPLPFSIGVDYRATVPATHPEAPIAVTTKLAKAEVGMGETDRLTATIRNVTDVGQPSTVARIGLPGGLAAQTWQLEDLREAGTIDFYETGEREVVLYLRDMAPGRELTVPLDLVAEVPGRFAAPASSAYLYYGNDRKTWVAGEEVVVVRAGR